MSRKKLLEKEEEIRSQLENIEGAEEIAKLFSLSFFKDKEYRKYSEISVNCSFGDIEYECVHELPDFGRHFIPETYEAHFEHNSNEYGLFETRVDTLRSVLYFLKTLKLYNVTVGTVLECLSVIDCSHHDDKVSSSAWNKFIPAPETPKEVTERPTVSEEDEPPTKKQKVSE